MKIIFYQYIFIILSGIKEIINIINLEKWLNIFGYISKYTFWILWPNTKFFMDFSVLVSRKLDLLNLIA
jgi:hypothetical protein